MEVSTTPFEASQAFLRSLALWVKFDNVFELCFLAPKGNPFFFAFVETEEIGVIVLDVKLELEFSFISVGLLLDVELELSRADRSAERIKAISIAIFHSCPFSLNHRT